MWLNPTKSQKEKLIQAQFLMISYNLINLFQYTPRLPISVAGPPTHQ